MTCIPTKGLDIHVYGYSRFKAEKKMKISSVFGKSVKKKKFLFDSQGGDVNDRR